MGRGKRVGKGGRELWREDGEREMGDGGASCGREKTGEAGFEMILRA